MGVAPYTICDTHIKQFLLQAASWQFVPMSSLLTVLAGLFWRCSHDISADMLSLSMHTLTSLSMLFTPTLLQE